MTTLSLFDVKLDEDDKDLVSYVGSVYRVLKRHYNDDVWCKGTLYVEASGESISFVGNCDVSNGDCVKIVGKWEDHDKWGRQLRVSFSVPHIPLTPEGIARVVREQHRGIGQVKGLLIGTFVLHDGMNDPDAVFTRLRDDMILQDELKKFAKLTNQLQAWEVAVSWLQGSEEYRVKATLFSMGVPPRAVDRVCNAYSYALALEQVRNNPYEVALSISGFDLAAADKVALGSLKWESTDLRRVRYGVVKALTKVAKNGHTWATRSLLCEATKETLKLKGRDGHQLPKGQIDIMIAAGELTSESLPEIGEVICAPDMLMNELLIKGFVMAKDSNPYFSSELPTGWFDSFPSEPSLEQKAAVKSFMENKVSVITGPAGCGKTFTVSLIVKLCLDRDLRLRLSAPTGKASKRMEEMLVRNIEQGKVTCQTIHKMLGYNGSTWRYGSGSSLPADVVIVDETSMVDIALMHRLVSCLNPNTSVVFVGDHNQLPSVGPGAILRDMVLGKLCNITKLNYVFRNAGPLRENAFDILQGRMRPTTFDTDRKIYSWVVDEGHADDSPETVLRAIVGHYEDALKAFGRDDRMKVQVLAPRYDGVVGINALNDKLRRSAHNILWDQDPPDDEDISIGDRVLQCKNDYKTNIMNGEQAIILDIGTYYDETAKKDKTGWTLQVHRDGRKEIVKVPSDRTKTFTLGYAITVHKFQGSEASVVICAAHSTMTRTKDDRNDHMLTQTLIYTMATRASLRVIFVGNPRGLTEGVKRIDDQQRRTMTASLQTLKEIRKQQKYRLGFLD